MTRTKQSLLSRFRRDERGNIIAMFGLALLPMLGMVGAAVDYSHAAMVRSRLQSALDATALKLSIDGANLSAGDLNTMANRYFGAVFDRSDIAGAPTLTVTRNGSKVDVAARANLDTAFMKLLGIDNVPVAAASVGAYDQTRIELALVLDNTGSMADNNKMVELKKAAANLIDQVAQLDPTGNRIKVSIVPFDRRVRVGAGYLKANWLGFKGEYKNFNDAAARNASWDGCVTDRYQSYDVNGTAPSQALSNTLYPGVRCEDPGQATSKLGAVQPLTSDWPSLKQTVAAMTPSGNTNVTIGFHWGLQVLSSGTTPLSLGQPFGTAHVKKYMVLLTDGDNTQNRWTTSSYQIDQRTKLMCDEVNDRNAPSSATAKGISVFTIRVMDGNSTLLKSCASDPSMYYEVQSATQINSVFSTIFDQITGVRLAS